MNLKSKIFGFAAASIFALSMTTGAMANDSVGGQVELVKGVCSVSINQASVDFGDWTYNGDEYVRTAGNNVAQLSGEVKAGRPGGTCNLTVQFSGLASGQQNIDASYFSVGANGTNWLNLDSSHASGLSTGITGNAPAISGSGYVMLDSVPETYQPGTYVGTLDVTINATN